MQIDFPHHGPFGDELAAAMQERAEDISNEPGLIWKIWTVNEEDQMAGGIYLFDNKADAQRYTDKHEKRLTEWGYTNIRALIFEVHEELSKLNNVNFV
jgi:hypothetical protein